MQICLVTNIVNVGCLIKYYDYLRGFEEVQKMNRWWEIYRSLYYYRTINLCKIFQESFIIGRFNEWTYQKNTLPTIQRTLPNPTIEIYPTNGAFKIAQMCNVQIQKQQQRMFRSGQFKYMDEYENIKSIASMNFVEINKIPQQKWFILHGYVNENESMRQILHLKPLNNQLNVIIVGLAISSLIIAKKLTKYGINTTIFINQPRSNVSLDQIFNQQFLSEGLMYFEGGNRSKSYLDLLKEQFQIQTVKPNNNHFIVSQTSFIDTRPMHDQFLSIIQQITNQLNNKSLFQEQINMRINKIGLTPQAYRAFKCLFSKTMMQNRMKGTHMSVGDLSKWMNFRRNANVDESQLAWISSWRPDKRIKIKVGLIQSIQLKNKIYRVTYRNGQNLQRYETSNYTHLIYAEYSKIDNSLQSNYYKVNEFKGGAFIEGFPVLQQLGSVKYIHCMIRLNQMVTFKQKSLNNQSNPIDIFSYECERLGWIHFYKMNTALCIMAVVKYTQQTESLSFYSDKILAILGNLCVNFGKMRKQLNGDVVCKKSCSFFMKSQMFLENVIKVREGEKMYISLPIITSYNPQKIFAHIELSNRICASILEENYSLKEYDGRLLQKEIEKQAQKDKNKHNSIKLEPKESKKQKQNLKKQDKQPEIKNSTVELKYKQQIADSKIQKKVENKQINHMINIKNKQEKDPFGINSQFVKNYFEFIKSGLNSINKTNYFLESQFDLSQPLQLYPQLHIINLGTLKQQENKLLPFMKKSKDSAVTPPLMIENYISRRESFSLVVPYFTTIYYQYIIIQNNEQFFVIVDVDYPNFIFFHRNIQILLSTLKTVSKLNISEQISKRKSLQIRRCSMKLSSKIPDMLVISNIRKRVQQQLSSVLQNPSNDTLTAHLTHKIHELISNERSCVSISPINNSIIRRNITIAEIRDHLKYVCGKNNLKLLTLSDVFLGRISPISMVMDLRGYSIDEKYIEKSYPQLYEGIEKVIQQQQSQTTKYRYYLKMMIEKERVIITRKFISSNINSKIMVLYNFQSELNNRSRRNNKKLYQIIEGNSKNMLFQDPQQCIQQLISNLLNRWTVGEIVQHWKQLIKQQLLKLVELSPLLKLYSQMTRNVTRDLSQQMVKTVQERCEHLTQQQKSTVTKAVGEGKVYMLGNSFICAI